MHQFLRLATSGGLYAWEFEKNGRSINVRVDGQLIFNGLGMTIKAAVAGAGLAFIPEPEVQFLIDQGELIPVLLDWTPYYPGYHLYYPSRRQQAPAFALLLDALRYRN